MDSFRKNQNRFYLNLTYQGHRCWFGCDGSMAPHPRDYCTVKYPQPDFNGSTLKVGEARLMSLEILWGRSLLHGGAGPTAPGPYQACARQKP